MDEIGLIFKCPKEDEKEDCPFKSIRSLNKISDRVLEWNNLVYEKKMEMIKHHYCCVDSKD